MSDKMTPKTGLFIARYLIHGNATLAAKEAGYAESSAHVTGSKLLKNAKVAAVIADRRALQAKRLEITADKVLRELAKLAFSDARDLFDERGRLRPIADLDEIARASIAGLDVETKEKQGVASIVTKIKLADKGLNLERLGRYLKLFTDRLELDGKVTLEQLVCGRPDDVDPSPGAVGEAADGDAAAA